MYTIAKLTRKSRLGFTLVELVVVLVILGAITAIAIPVYNNYAEGSDTKAINANVQLINNAIEHYKMDNSGSNPAATTDLTGGAQGSGKKYIKIWPTGPNGYTYTIASGAASAVAPE